MIYWGDLPKACHCLKQAVRPIHGHILSLKLKATTDCNLTSEMHKASPSDTATGSSLHYFAHIVKVKFVLTHLLTVLTKHAWNTTTFGEADVIAIMRHYFSKTSTFHGDFGTYFSALTSAFSWHTKRPPTIISYFSYFGHIFYQTHHFRQSYQNKLFQAISDTFSTKPTIFVNHIKINSFRLLTQKQN